MVNDRPRQSFRARKRREAAQTETIRQRDDEKSALHGEESAARGAVQPVRGCSSDGRALQSHCRGQGFDSPQLHQPPGSTSNICRIKDERASLQRVRFELARTGCCLDLLDARFASAAR